MYNNKNIEEWAIQIDERTKQNEIVMLKIVK